MNGLLVGRFQPFHLGHVHAIRFALSKADALWLGIGSSNRPLEGENPFSVSEREEMIRSSLDAETLEKIQIYGVPDLDDHGAWIEALDGIVPEYGMVFSRDGRTGHLLASRGAEVVPVPFTQRDELSGTNIRKKILANQDWHHLVPRGTKKVLERIDARARLLRV